VHNLKQIKKFAIVESSHRSSSRPWDDCVRGGIDIAIESAYLTYSKGMEFPKTARKG
jgi:hypothetical protein